MGATDCTQPQLTYHLIDIWYDQTMHGKICLLLRIKFIWPLRNHWKINISFELQVIIRLTMILNHYATCTVHHCSMQGYIQSVSDSFCRIIWSTYAVRLKNFPSLFRDSKIKSNRWCVSAQSPYHNVLDSVWDHMKRQKIQTNQPCQPSHTAGGGWMSRISYLKLQTTSNELIIEVHICLNYTHI